MSPAKASEEIDDQRISCSMALDISCTKAGSPVHPTRAARRPGEADCHS